MEFKDKVVMITGPAKGMGSAITLAFAREGAKLALLGRDVAAIEAVARESRALSAQVLVAQADMTTSEGVRRAVEQACQAYGGRIDVLVTVAGVSGPLDKLMWETTEDEYDNVMDVNVKGIFLMLKYVVPVMIGQRSGKIVNIGGTYGFQGKDYRSIYSASKWALRGLTKSLALEVGKHNINVNLVCPGSTEGPRFENVLDALAKRIDCSYDEARDIYESNIAMRRVATAEDIADATLFLASERSRNITGVELPVDGGSVLLTFPPSVPRVMAVSGTNS